MKVTLNQITFSKKEYFNLLVKLKLVSVWYMYLFPFALAIFMKLSFQDNQLFYFLLVFGLVYPAWNLIYISLYTNSSKNESLYIPRDYVFTDTEIITTLKDGSSSVENYKKIYTIKELNDCVLIYLSKSSFIFLPKTHITENEIESIKNLIRKVKGNS